MSSCSPIPRPQFPPGMSQSSLRQMPRLLGERTRHLEPVSHRNSHPLLLHNEQALLGWNGPPQNSNASGNQGPHVKSAVGNISYPRSSSNCCCRPRPPSTHWEPSQLYTLSPLPMVTHSLCSLDGAPVEALTYPTLPQPADQNRT